jgi:hypothetical protein
MSDAVDQIIVAVRNDPEPDAHHWDGHHMSVLIREIERLRGLLFTADQRIEQLTDALGLDAARAALGGKDE